VILETYYEVILEEAKKVTKEDAEEAYFIILKQLKEEAV